MRGREEVLINVHETCWFDGCIMMTLVTVSQTVIQVLGPCWRKMDVAPSTNEKQLICMLSKVLAKLDRKFSHSHLDSFFLNEHVNHLLHPLP